MVSKAVTYEVFEVFVALPENVGRRFELIDGEIIEKMASTQDHTVVATRICAYLTIHLDTHSIDGYTTGESGGFTVGEQKMIPDCALVLEARSNTEVYTERRPVLVIEIISDETSKAELDRLRAHRAAFLDIGATIWETHQTDRSVDVFGPGDYYHRETQTLVFDGIDPPFRLDLDVVFAKIGEQP